MKRSIVTLLVTMAVAALSAAPAGVVTRSGRNFMLNGGKFYYGGTNIFYLLTSGDTAMVRTTLKKCKDIKVSVIRTWGFDNDSSALDSLSPGSLQPSLGVFDEEGFKRVDYVLKLANEYGIRFVIALVNQWGGNGDYQWYIDQCVGSGKAKATFYTDSKCKEAYKKYVNFFLSRTNSYTGVKYKEDPAIFSWQLCNEPRNRGSSSNNTDGTVLNNWLKEMAAYVKSIDPNHLVSTGEEGGGTYGNKNPTGAEDGVDFDKNTGISDVDYATVHLYPISWGSWSDNDCTNYLQNRMTIIRKHGKPGVFEEFGLEKDASGRDSRFPKWLDAATNSSNDYDGFNCWMLDEMGKDSWAFTFSSNTASIIAKYAKVQFDKSDPKATMVAVAPSFAEPTAWTVAGGSGGIRFGFPVWVEQGTVSIFNAAGVQLKSFVFTGNNGGSVTADWRAPGGACWCVVRSGTSRAVVPFVNVR